MLKRVSGCGVTDGTSYRTKLYQIYAGDQTRAARCDSVDVKKGVDVSYMKSEKARSGFYEEHLIKNTMACAGGVGRCLDGCGSKC